MMKRMVTALSAAAFLALPSLRAQEYSDAYLDTVVIAKSRKINDYFMVGAQYGYSFLNTDFNPTRDTKFRPHATAFGLTVTRHYAMTGIFSPVAEAISRSGIVPYFGFQAGLLYGHEGFRFKVNKDTGRPLTLDYATGTLMETVEVPIMMQLYMDAGTFKVLLPELGLYGGYRYSIKRDGMYVDEDYRHAFRDTDYRWEYGFRAGLGFALVFDPIEIHVKGTLNFSLKSLYHPDYYSQYYYRFAYPYDITLSVGLHYQLTNRQGRSRKQLSREAKRMVYTDDEQQEETL